MKVTLIAFTAVTNEVFDRLDSWDADTQSRDALAEYAGRLCYRSYHKPNPDTATNEGYLRNIIRQQHFSVLEHASATFLIEDVSRHLLGELTRHRHTSPSVESLRYCRPRGYAVHPTLADFALEDELEAAWKEALARYNQVYDRLIAAGLKKKQAAEAAAQFLPLATTTDLVLTGNMRAWRELIGKRDADGANREIQKLAKLVLPELKQAAPNTFQDFTLEPVR